MSPALLVDPDAGRLAEASERWQAPGTHDAFEHLSEFDVAIVAVPHHLHAKLCGALLAAEKHVLVEKPLATNGDDARALVEAEARASATLHVGHNRRFLAINAWLRRLVLERPLGDLQRVTLQEGVVDFWQASTDTHLRRESAGGGVLLGIGVHALDVLRWWLGELSVEEYRDDSRGGIEANASLQLTTASGIPVSLELSRVRDLANTVRLEFSGGTVVASLHFNLVSECPRLSRTMRPPQQQQSFEDMFVAQLQSWLDGLDGTPTEVVTAQDAAATIELVQACYASRQALRFPWSYETVAKPS